MPRKSGKAGMPPIATLPRIAASSTPRHCARPADPSMSMLRSLGWKGLICCGRSLAGCRPRSSTPIILSRLTAIFSPAPTGWRPAITWSRRSAPRSASWSSATPSRCGARQAFAQEPSGRSTSHQSTTRIAARCSPNTTRPALMCGCGMSRPISALPPSSAISEIGPRDEPGRLRRFHGAGCHPDRVIALTRALTEAAQSRLTYIAGIRDDLLPSEYEEPPTADIVDALLDALRQESEPHSFREVPSFCRR